MFKDKLAHQKLDAIIAMLARALNLEAQEMATLTDLQAKVAAQKTVIDSGVTLLQGLKAQLDAAIASGDMTQVQSISDALDANTNELSAAIAANTPSAPPA